METAEQVVKRLEPEYLQGYRAMGMSENEARDHFDGLVMKAKEWCQLKQLGGVNADALLALARDTPGIRAEMEWRMSEGVREADVRWWWNMHDMERQMILATDETIRLGYYVSLREQGHDTQETVRLVAQGQWVFTEFLRFVKSGTPRDAHFPLPVELKQRVLIYQEQQRAADPTGANWKKSVCDAGSVNAAIRNAILLGLV